MEFEQVTTPDQEDADCRNNNADLSLESGHHLSLDTSDHHFSLDTSANGHDSLPLAEDHSPPSLHSPELQRDLIEAADQIREVVEETTPEHHYMTRHESKNGNHEERVENEPLAAKMSEAERAELEATAASTRSMRAKWDQKIVEEREAKVAAPLSAGKGRSVARLGGGDERCPICTKTVYAAEKVVAGKGVFHRLCFKCVVCKITLRTESYEMGQDGALYCKKHYVERFCNMAQNCFDGARAAMAPVGVVQTQQ